MLTRLGFDRLSGVYLWVAFIVVFGILRPDTFLTSTTLHAVASQQAIDGLIAIAVLVPLVCGQFDLSVGYNANLCGITAIILQNQHGWAMWTAVLFGIAIGLMVGVVNAVVVVRLHVNSFIATLGMGTILSAVQVIVTNSEQPPPARNRSYANLTQHQVFGFQIVILYLLVAGVIAWWFLDHTPDGRYIRSTGANPDAARLSGVRVDRWSSVSLLVSGGIAGLGGVLYTSLTGPSLSFGPTLLLPAFAAAFLGSTQFFPGRFNVWGTLLAIYVLATGVKGMQLVSGQQWLNDMFNGVALIVAVALAAARGRIRRPRWRRRTAGSSSDLDLSTESGVPVA